MNITWEGIKEIFYAIGAVAGLIALFRPVLQHKYDLDNKRYEKINSELPEELFMSIEFSTWQSRLINDDLFTPLNNLCREIEHNLESVRFSGPLSKWYKIESGNLVNVYRKYREYVQVPEWEPENRDNKEQEKTIWRFNKQAFKEGNRKYDDYVKHLEEAEKLAEKMHLHAKRLQIISELHILETPLAFYLIPKRIKKIEQQKT